MLSFKARWHQEFIAFGLALTFLTRIPWRLPATLPSDALVRGNSYFPWVGLLIGLISVAFYSLASTFWPILVSVLLLLLVQSLLTGALHEDGLADSADGLAGGANQEQRLQIFKDSRVGVYGVLAIVIASALKVALWLAHEPLWVALLVAPAVARFTPLLLMSTLSYVQSADQSKVHSIAQGLSHKRLVWAASLPLLAALLTGTLLPTLAATALVAVFWGLLLRKLLGGVTGDVLGASVFLTELVWLLLWVALA
jgi:adenosylcobinamide-GDP ribazoletransferase